jgi:hypothetical protein
MSTSNAFLRKIARAPVTLCRKAGLNEKKYIDKLYNIHNVLMTTFGKGKQNRDFVCCTTKSLLQ